MEDVERNLLGQGADGRADARRVHVVAGDGRPAVVLRGVPLQVHGTPRHRRHHDALCSRMATNRKSQVVPDFDIRWENGGPHYKGGPYEVEKGGPPQVVPDRHGSE